jgi:hypothetical protein
MGSPLARPDDHACAQQAGFNPIGWPKNCP